MPETTSAFSIQHLDFYYGQKKALSNITMEIPPRKVTARVPRESVRVRNGRATVDLVSGLGFRETPVRLGAADDTHVEVSGLPVGARVRARH